jgi:hypothetical protein
MIGVGADCGLLTRSISGMMDALGVLGS